jgi:hypothetical protein
MAKSPKYLQISRFLSVVSCCVLLTGCPYPMTNSIGLFKPDSLPFTPKDNLAMLYILQPYFIVDWDFIGGAASDGAKYHGVIFYLTQEPQQGKTNNTDDFSYIGETPSVCLYLNPGKYKIKAVIPNSTQAPLEYNFTVKPNQIQFVGAKETSYSGEIGFSISWQEISASQALKYIDPSQLTTCPKYSDIAYTNVDKVKIDFNYKAINHTTQNIYIQNDQPEIEAIASDELANKIYNNQATSKQSKHHNIPPLQTNEDGQYSLINDTQQINKISAQNWILIKPHASYNYSNNNQIPAKYISQLGAKFDFRSKLSSGNKDESNQLIANVYDVVSYNINTQNLTSPKNQNDLNEQNDIIGYMPTFASQTKCVVNNKSQQLITIDCAINILPLHQVK